MCVCVCVKVKKEICWDEEEERLRERKSQTAKHSSSDSDMSDGEEPPRPKRRRRLYKNGRRFSDSGRRVVGGDVSETLYETEYQSEYDPIQEVQSGPEEMGCGTPPPCPPEVRGREAYSAPRLPQRCRKTSAQTRGVARLRTRSPIPIANPDIPNGDGFVSGYDSGSDYLSGPGECVAQRTSSKPDSDPLEYISAPDLSHLDTGAQSPEIFSPPPPISPSRFDEDIPVVSTGVVAGDEQPKRTNSEEKEKKLVENVENVFAADAQPIDFTNCTCENRPEAGERSHDPHMTTSNVVNNAYTNITYVTYYGMAPSSNCPSCCTSQCYSRDCHTYHHPPPPHQCPYCHPSHPHHFTTDDTPCNCVSTIASLGEAEPNGPDPSSNVSANKRKLDTQLSDQLSDGTEPTRKNNFS